MLAERMLFGRKESRSGAAMGVRAESILNLNIEVPSQTRYLSLVGNIAEGLAREADGTEGDPQTLAYRLNLAVTEAVANAIKHCTKLDPSNTVRIRACIDDKGLLIEVFDHGQGFDLKDAQAAEADSLQEHGRGLFLIRSVMDSVEYRKDDGWNVLKMRKNFEHDHSLPM